MSGRHRRALERAATTHLATSRRLAGAGASAAAGLLAVAPMASASAHPAPTSASATTGATDAGVRPAAPAAKAVAATPDYGFQKVRVGVQVKDGSWVPAGTTTAGSTITITETGPNAEGLEPTTCQTQASTQEAGSTATYCVFPQELARTEKAAAAPSDVPADQLYTARPGDTVTVQQKTVEPNLVIDPVAQTVDPCELPADPNGPICADVATRILNDPGLPPAAKNDAGTAPPGGSVRIAVLGNDTTQGAPATVKIVQKPSHGTAKVVNGAITYTPDAGYSGADSLRYSLTTPNGSSVATVALRVAAPPTARDDSASTAAGTAVTVDVLANDRRNGGGALSIRSVGHAAHGTVEIRDGEVRYVPAAGFAGTDTFTYVAANSLGTDTATVTVTVTGVANTGVDSGELTGLAALLLVTGGAASVAGRRRYRARHATSA